MKKNKSRKKQIIEAKDCLAFDSKWNQVLYNFAESNESFNIFNTGVKESEPLITYNYFEKRWYAGRYIGSIDFKYKKDEYTINITPRFGDAVLLSMFEELFNIKFSPGSSKFSNTNDSYYIRILIAFIWLQKLANANRHGLPKVKVDTINKGYSVKGRLLVRPTIKTIYTSGEVISGNKEKIFDQVILNILKTSCNILKKNYHLGRLSIPENAKDAIHQLEKKQSKNDRMTYHDYKSIKLHPMYQNYKGSIDLSWQIIQSEPGFSSRNNNQQVSGFFLDMAEIWESYIRSIIIKEFITRGWQKEEPIYSLYKNKFYQRKIIPDIVLNRDNDYLVFDAKYKKMEYRSGFTDVDRNDFFQIHTYISYLNELGNVKLGGLIYPVTRRPIVENKIIPGALFDINKNTLFFADGPLLEANTIDIKDFINRITYIDNKEKELLNV